VQKKKKNKTDCIFYDGEIANIKSKKGTIFSLMAIGDIRINVKDDIYRNENIQEGINKHKLSDSKIKMLEDEGKLSWENNNWFEVCWIEKGSDTWEFDCGEVAYDYDSAIELLKSYIEKENKIDIIEKLVVR